MACKRHRRRQTCLKFPMLALMQSESVGYKIDVDMGHGPGSTHDSYERHALLGTLAAGLLQLAGRTRDTRQCRVGVYMPLEPGIWWAA